MYNHLNTSLQKVDLMKKNLPSIQALQAKQGHPQHVLHDARGGPVHRLGGHLRPMLRNQQAALSHRSAGSVKSLEHGTVLTRCLLGSSLQECFAHQRQNFTTS